MAEKTPDTLTVGDAVPEFAAPNQDGQLITSKALLGTPYVLYFYPKDNTPGCTTEACDFQEKLTDYRGLGFTVIGVSRDSQKSHQNFRAKYHLDFDLLSDTDEVLCRAFGVLKEKNMYGRKVFGIERSTFVVDKDGKLVGIFRGVKAKTHVEKLLSHLKG